MKDAKEQICSFAINEAIMKELIKNIRNKEKQNNENNVEVNKKRQERKEKLFRKFEYFNRRYFLCTFIEALFLNFIMEAICRHSLIEPFIYLFRNPIMFLFNALILFLLFSFGSIFRHRILYVELVTVAFLILAVTNGILLCFRTTPFAAIDLTLISNVMTIIDLYLSWIQIVLIIIAIVVIVLIAVFVGLKCPKYEGKMHRLPVIVLTVVYFLSMMGLDSVLIRIGVSTENYSNLASAYQNYGFVYCFTNSFMKLGMEKPDNYSPEAVEAIVNDKLNEEDMNVVSNSVTNGTVAEEIDTTGEEDVQNSLKEDISQSNIIFVQLESFFDMTRVIGLELSQDPIPNFRYLKENYSSGFLYVPSVGAGTANTEFEIITGMDMDFFGPGEYPYKTILKETTCESAAYDLEDLGYATHAIHNNDGTFYDRHIVYSQLGFETFTPVEYMYDVDRNVNGFAKDYILTNEILETLTSTRNRDYIYAVSVQAHGDYSDVRQGDPQPIFVRYTNETKENAWSYYVNQIKEVDQFIGELIDLLEHYEEPTILVLYGDHIPGMGLEMDDITNERLTATEYVIWSNYDMTQEDKDLEAYQLTSQVLEMAGISNGVMNAFHQKSMDDENYLQKLELLQYDMLYGNREVYGGINPYTATDMKLGICTRNIIINSVTAEEDGSFYVRGNNYNDYSVVYCNGSALETTYIDQCTLEFIGDYPKTGDIYTVAQVGTDKFPLGFCEEYTY